MPFASFAIRAITALRRSVSRAVSRRHALASRASASTRRAQQRALRDSAAFALSGYWARCGDGGSLVVYRDERGNARHVAYEDSDGTCFDARGTCNEDLVARRLGVRVTASHCEESDIQPLLGAEAELLESADALRRHIERHGAWPETGTRRS